MRSRAISTAFVSALLIFVSEAHAAPHWGVELALGGAWNLPLGIVIRQDDFPELSQVARWSTRAFEPPLYYRVQLQRMDRGAGWALALTHHKIYLDNPPAEVVALAVSHGFNLLTLDRAFEARRWRRGVGAGVVIAHPESEIRGRRLPAHEGILRTGYYLSGPVACAFFGRSRGVGGRFDASVEIRLTAAYASVPIGEGSARVPNVALHLTAGLGAWAGR